MKPVHEIHNSLSDRASDRMWKEIVNYVEIWEHTIMYYAEELVNYMEK